MLRPVSHCYYWGKIFICTALLLVAIKGKSDQLVELLSQESFTSSLVVILSGVKELAMMCSVKSHFPRLRCQGKTELCLAHYPLQWIVPH